MKKLSAYHFKLLHYHVIKKLQYQLNKKININIFNYQMIILKEYLKNI